MGSDGARRSRRRNVGFGARALNPPLQQPHRRLSGPAVWLLLSRTRRFLADGPLAFVSTVCRKKRLSSVYYPLLSVPCQSGSVFSVRRRTIDRLAPLPVGLGTNEVPLHIDRPLAVVTQGTWSLRAVPPPSAATRAMGKGAPEKQKALAFPGLLECFRGDGGARTHDEGFADPCLTWPYLRLCSSTIQNHG